MGGQWAQLATVVLGICRSSKFFFEVDSEVEVHLSAADCVCTDFWALCSKPSVPTLPPNPLCPPYLQTLCAHATSKPSVPTLLPNPLRPPYLQTLCVRPTSRPSVPTLPPNPLCPPYLQTFCAHPTSKPSVPTLPPNPGYATDHQHSLHICPRSVHRLVKCSVTE